MKEYLRYLFAKPNNNNFCNWLTRIICRIKGHPAGVVWYTSDPNSIEPNMKCKTCNDDLS